MTNPTAQEVAPPSPKSVEWWILQLPQPLLAEANAPGLEADGWDGVSYGDNQCRVGDVVLTLGLAAKATTKLRFTTGCTNAVTRHPTILAATWANLQEISGGRVMLGIGRGDSALADIGLAMQPVAQFEKSMSQLHTLLAGGSVDFEPDASVPGIESLGYAASNTETRIAWMDPAIHTAPLDITVSGPRNIGVAGRHADRVTFSVGADPERISWAMNLCREEAEKAGRDPDSLSYAAYVQVICHEDRQYAMSLGKSIVALHARLQGLGKASGPVSEEDRKIIESLPENYDMTVSGQGGSQVDLISDDFAQRFAVYGPPEDCIKQLRGVIETGIDAIVVNAPMRVGTEEERRENLHRISHEIIPVLRDVPATV